MYLFLSQARVKKSRVCFAVVSLRLALFVLRIEQWFSDMCFDLPQSSAIWCLTPTESWCCEIECSGWALSRSPKTLAISGRRQEPVFWIEVLLSQHLSSSLLLSFILLYLSALLSVFVSRGVISGRGNMQELLALLRLRSYWVVYVTSWFPVIDFSFFSWINKETETCSVCLWCPSHRLSSPPAKKVMHEKVQRTMGVTGRGEEKVWCWEGFSGKNHKGWCFCASVLDRWDKSYVVTFSKIFNNLVHTKKKWFQKV